MPERAQILRIVVASPGDVNAERAIVPRVAEELNMGIAADRGLRLEVIRWETDTYPGFHPEGPQGLIDEILHIEDCDVVIGIFWKRFGTPTKDGTTGTEHEIRRAYEAWEKHKRPQVMVYFNQKPSAPQSEEEANQWGQVKRFQKEFPKEGLWRTYKSVPEFERLLRTHLTNFIRKEFPVEVSRPLGGLASSGAGQSAAAVPVVSIAQEYLQGRATVAAPAPGTVIVNPKDGLKYVWIPPGTFQMGCSPGDRECDDDEKPAHKVRISRGFWIGQTPVTVGAYKRFAEATGRQMPAAPKFNKGWTNENMPIVNVTWNDARAYCAWVGGRLPTEAEWEYATRGGSLEARYGPIDEIAWYSGNSGNQAHDVAQKRPNGFGLYDTLGNVWEWVNDWYDLEYYQNSLSQDPPGPTNGQYRVRRGGSWGGSPRNVRVSDRGGDLPGGWSNRIGLRCGREVE